MKNGMAAKTENSSSRFSFWQGWKRWFVAGLLLLLGLALWGVFYYRSGKFNHYLAGEVVAALQEYGLRAEVGQLEIGRGLRSVTLRDVKVYNEQTGQPIATIASLTLTAQIREPFAFRLSREIEIQRLEVEKPEVWIEFDAAGRSNLDGLRQPPPRASRRITVDYASLIGAITNGRVHYRDQRYNTIAELNELRAELQPLNLESAPQVRMQMTSGAGRLRRNDRETRIETIEFSGRLQEAGAEIDRLRLQSPLLAINATGKVDDWDKLHYQLQTEARVALGDVREFLAPDTALSGTANFTGQVEGTGAEYRVKGRLQADELNAAGLRVRGAQAEEIQLAQTADALQLTTSRLRTQLITDGKFRATNVAVADLRSEYRDEKLSLNAGRVDAAQFDSEGKLRVTGVGVSDLRGEYRDENFNLNAARVDAARFDSEQAQAAGIRLSRVVARINEKQTSATGEVNINSAVAAPVRLGVTRATFSVTPQTVTLKNLGTALLGGTATGDLALSLTGGTSRLQAKFNELKTSDLFTLAKARNAPLAGTVTGNADVNWPGTNAEQLTGNINARFAGQTTQTADVLPLTGEAVARAQRGVFNFERLLLNTDATKLEAKGSLAPDGNSALNFSLTSTRGEELLMIAQSFDAARPTIEQYKPLLAGEFRFEGTLSGQLQDPTLVGTAQSASVGLNNTVVGSLAGRLLLSPTELRFENGDLKTPNGGAVQLTYAAPRAAGAETGTLDATFTRIVLEDAIKAAGLTSQQKYLEGEVNGEAHLTGLPAAPRGNATVKLDKAILLGQSAEAITANVVFDERTVRLDQVEAKLPQGTVTASGEVDLKTKNFTARSQAKQLDLPSTATALELTAVNITGTADADVRVSGNLDNLDQLQIELNAAGQQVTVNSRAVGQLTLTVRTNPNGRIDAEFLTDITGNPQTIAASIELRQPGRPLTVRSELSNVDIATVMALGGVNSTAIEGSLTGTLNLNGPLVNARDEFNLDALRGNLSLTAITLAVSGNPLTITTPFEIALNNSQLQIESTRITGQGTDLRLGGTVGLRTGAAMNFALNGTVNLDTFNRINPDVFVSGELIVDARAVGSVSEPRLAGELRIVNAAVTALDAPVGIEAANGRIVLAGDRITLNDFTATAGDGPVRASGEMQLKGLQPATWKLDATASEVGIYYQGVRATANATMALAGTPERQTLSGTINVPIAEYTSNFGTDGVIGSGGLTGGIGTVGSSDSFFPPIDLNLRVEARDSILIRNEQVNTVASALVDVRGTLTEPDISGRATIDGGTIKFRGQRYEITSGTVELPGGFGAEPQLNLLAEGDVSGYRVSVGFDGPIDSLEVSLRSEPQLARAEILSLIATGRTETGTLNSEDLARSGLDTAASFLSEEFISKPVAREAEKLLGMNRFQIDPVLRPNANPAARLTLGKQIARGLTLTYSTNLANEQDQTALAEYTLTNRFSLLASFTQGGSSTRQGASDNDFTIEMRGRKRFALGADKTSIASVSTDSIKLVRPVRAPLPPALVAVNKPDQIKLSEDQMRLLLPIIRDGYSRALTRLGERNLTNYLQEQGYFFAEVRSRCEPASCTGSDLRVFYDASPGQRYKLTDVKLQGTKEIDEGDVKGELQTQESSLLSGVPLVDRLPLVGAFVGQYARGITSTDRLRNDRETIRRRMVDLGFRSARVESRLGVTPDNENLVIIYDVTEGPRSTVAEVILHGNIVASAEELRKIVPIQDGASFSPTSAREGAQRLREHYAQRGYLEAKIEVTLTDLPNDRLQLNYQVNEGAQSVAQEVNITGNIITRTDAIRKYLNFASGDILTPQTLRRPQRDLYATGAFREVNVKPEPFDPNDPAARRVNVSVTEAQPLLFVYGLGYSTDDGGRGLGQLTHTNLFGRLITGSLRLRGSRREQFAQLQFTDLRPFNTPWATTFSIFFNRNADLRPFVRQRLVNGQVEDASTGRSFGINRFATFLQTERKLNEQTSLRFRYSFDNARLFNLENVPDLEVTRNEKAVRLGQFSVGLSRDTRDNALNPSKGQLVSADYSVAARIFGGNESFHKFFGTYQRFQTLSPKVPLLGNSVVAVSARLGLARAFRVIDRDGNGVITDPERQLPISERFFSGGATTLRGFKFEAAGPQGVLEPRAANELPTLVPLGGDALAVFNFELRYPLTERLRLVPFYDLGNVFRRVRDVRFSGMTHTVGLGLRFNTPVGPVGIDYGYLLNPPSFTTATGGLLRQHQGVIHIRFGQTF